MAHLRSGRLQRSTIKLEDIEAGLAELERRADEMKPAGESAPSKRRAFEVQEVITDETPVFTRVLKDSKLAQAGSSGYRV
jgi:hypothetical protein